LKIKLKIKHVLFSLLIFSAACGVANTLGDFSKPKFRLSSAANVKLAGVDINNKNNFYDLSDEEVEYLYKVVYDEKIPLSFDLYVTVLNPNSGKENTPPADIFLKSFPYKLDRKSVV